MHGDLNKLTITVVTFSKKKKINERTYYRYISSEELSLHIISVQAGLHHRSNNQKEIPIDVG